MDNNNCIVYIVILFCFYTKTTVLAQTPQNEDTTKLKLEISDHIYHYKFNSSKAFYSSEIENKQITGVPYKKSKQNGVGFVENIETGQLEERTICFADLNYTFILKNKSEIKEIFNNKLSEVNISRRGVNYPIKEISITIWSNFKFIDKTSESKVRKENFKNKKFENFIWKKFYRNGGVVRLIIYFMENGIEKSIYMRYAYFGENEEYLEKRYQKLKNKGKLYTDKNNPDCHCYPDCK